MSVGPRIDDPAIRVDSLSLAKRHQGTGLRKHLSAVLGVTILVFNDLLALVISMGLAYLSRVSVLPFIYEGFQPIQRDALLNLWWFPLLTVIVLAYEGMYHNRLPFWRGAKRLVKAVTWSIVFAILFMYLSKSLDYSRALIVLTYIYAVLLLPLSRYLIKFSLNKAGLWQKSVLILGAGKTAELVIKGFERESTMGYRPVGLLEDDPKKKGILRGNRIVPVLGKFEEVEEVMKRTGVRDVIIAVPGLENKKLVNLTNLLQNMSANVMLVPDLFGIPLTGIRVNHLFDEKTLMLSMQNNLASVCNVILKRTFDIVVACSMLTVVLPVMIGIVIAIIIDSKGPAIFAHKRVGKDGKSFKCFKFRTMVTNSQDVLEKLLASNPEIREEWEREFKLKNDPRITRVGNFLRKTSLDELPQIFNVLLGQMSLVGPRPIVQKEVEKYGEYFKDFKMVLPGITGLWQVSGRNDVDYDERVQLDVWYVRNWSLWMDITILIRTVGVVLGKKGAY
ncbi:undecaprenyl-phosphate galactose phosphotransferase WbaP [Desulforamulus aquiferis]|uniref:Undecaprenyl-phosphate galactose phosphotransferase WbaP n=1 Tax=Desulforamulus aquiferis TaxID=1397668 RepID=A0AAW7ZC15_9FIRM|nr:undecaprenyl-phosphate galactose phosphotransferase WbaP [Desulforamulus aquiferis]MDO7786862.1 undecaprenyl-phosphate galactose phosphotransferase WbaP [Desulforamulus aquiferis]